MITISNKHQGNAAHGAATSLRELARELELAPSQGAPGSVSYSIHAAAVSRLRAQASDTIEHLALRSDDGDRAEVLAVRDTLATKTAAELRTIATAWDEAAADWE